MPTKTKKSRKPKLSGTSKPKLCGAKLDNGNKCHRGAGWGGGKQGRCKDHDKAADAKIQARKREFILEVSKGDAAIITICSRMGIDQSTIWRDRQEDEEFDAGVITALKQSDHIRNTTVEDKFFQRLITGEANDTAYFFYLCNRLPKRWRHVQNIVIEGGEEPLKYQDVTMLRNDFMSRISRMRDLEN